MNARPASDMRARVVRRARRAAAFLLIAAVQFGLFEAGLRVWSHSEAGPSFQGLFDNDPVVGHTLKPHARVRFTTSDFETDIRINGAGVRDDEELGPKQAGERRIVLLGDSLVLAVQVGFHQTFGELLEAELNRRSTRGRYRVINAGVQGYGPIEEMLFFQRFGHTLQPDLVITFVYVGNDAEEAVTSQGKLNPATRARTPSLSDSLASRGRRLVRRSMVLQTIRLRVVTATDRFRSFSPPEPPVQSYAAQPAPRIAEGIALTRGAVLAITSEAAALGATSAIVLMPARFQVDDGDYGRLRDIVSQAGGELVRDAATERFDRALADVPVPRIDMLPALRRSRPGPDLFFQTTAHLTAHGHRVVAGALAEFLEAHPLLAPAGNEAVR